MGGAVAGVAAAAARARRQVISHFMAANAVSAEQAVPFTPGRRMEAKFFDQMRDRGVILPAKNGGYYVDPPALDAYQQGRRKLRGLALLTAAVAMGAGVAIGLIG